MKSQTKTIGTSMRELRLARQYQEPSTLVPVAMVESIRQSLRIEGHDISAKEARNVIEHSVKDAYVEKEVV